jgi:glucose/arabinose dehydrogenase
MKYIGIFFFLLIIIAVLFLRQHPSVQNSPSSTINNTNNLNQHISSGAIPDISLQLPPGFTVHVFATGLGNPRVLKFSPGGTLLVSDPTNNKIIALPDSNHQGAATEKKITINSGNHIHGLAFYGGKLFVAEVNRVVRYSWDEKNLQASFEKVLFALPNNNDHNNRTITFDRSGRMYVSVGSTCNVCLEASDWSGTVVVSDVDGNNPQVFAKGLRNAAFTAINPKTGQLWGTEMGRDYLGDNLPPDEINIIQQGKNYGWPLCFGNKVHDTNFDPSSVDPCGDTEAPIYEISAHSAPLGLVFINSAQLPNDWQGDLLVAYHGSWNRSIPTGYKIVHMKVEGNAITQVSDFLTGFLQGNVSLSRPVDLAFDTFGNLYISDDQAGNVYIVQKSN